MKRIDSTDNFFATAELYHALLTNSTTWIDYAYVFNNAITVILGLPANCYIVWLMLTGKGTGYVSDFFSLNLAICEIIYCSGCLISFSVVFFPIYSAFQNFISVVTIFGRPLFLCLICVERYVAVVHPVTFLKFKPLRYRLVCSAVVWMIVAGFGVFCMFTLPSNNMYMFICVVLPQYSVFLIIKLFCCLAVLRALKHPGPGERGKQRKEANHMKRRAFTIILVLTVTMVINYTPFLFAGLCYGWLPMNDFLTFWSICVVICMVVAFVQPFMYIQRFGKLTQVLRIFHLKKIETSLKALLPSRRKQSLIV